jgi:16S rRNA A1518/A1519 N6-dimethyltransferase RsmA/KsgA/DIM1 with predicted DNA glycosylase/AP lyase activity
VAGRASGQARPRGRHFLRSRGFADRIVRDAGIEAGTLVLDLGAGGGALTRALVDAGACVRAVELDPAALRQLETRFGGDGRVEVVEGDATVVPSRPSRSPSSRIFPSPQAPRSCAVCWATRAYR